MYNIYRTHVDELDIRFINSSPANHAHLLKAIDNIAHHRNLVTVNLDEFLS